MEKICRGVLLKVLDVIVIVFVPALEINSFLYCVNILEFNKSFAQFILNPGKILSEWPKQRQKAVDLRVLSLWIEPESELLSS